MQVEASNVELTGDSLTDLVQASTVGPSRGRSYMPTFYLLGRLISPVVRDPVLRVKVVSTLSGILLPFVVALLAFRLTHGNVAAPLSALLVALNPLLVAYSVEGRPYSTFLVLLTAYLYLLLAPSPWTARNAAAFGGVALCGALSHVLFLPLALIAFALKALLVPQTRGDSTRTTWVLAGVSLAALSCIVAVLATPEASSHFTGQVITPQAVLRAASGSLRDLIGVSVPTVPYSGLFALSFCILFAATQRSGPTKVALLTMFVPFLGFVAADLLVGGIRSTVPRYNITVVVGFSLVVAIMLEEMWRRHRFIAALCVAPVVGFVLTAPSDFGRHLKGGRYEELAWYLTTYGNQRSMVLSTVPGTRSMEFAANSHMASEIVPVVGAPSPFVIRRVRAALDSGVPVLSIVSLDGSPPQIPGGVTRWIEEFVGAQTVVYRLVMR